MKFSLVILVTFSVGILTAQNDGIFDNQGNSVNSVSKANAKDFAGVLFFMNPNKAIKGTVYLFDDWENSAIIVSQQNKRYLVRNVNINIKFNYVQSRISNDSLFTFNFNNIDKFIINYKDYKNLYNANKGSRIYEVIYESNEFSILKGFDLQLVSGSPNPMVNRPNDKYVRNKGYYLSLGSTIEPFRLSKKGILKLLKEDQSKISKIEQFMHSNSLSYKKEEDVKKALEYCNDPTN